MSEITYYGDGFPYASIDKLPGKLIVIEGTDGVGRSTQIRMLKKWLEEKGYGAWDTGLARSKLTQEGLDEAKKGHKLSKLTMSLFYATDFADRLEYLIIPALKAGFYVLSDRYFYSIIARNAVRGVDQDWARKVYGFAIKPDIVFYLKIDLSTLLVRTVNSGDFDYWESGMDIRCADNLYDSFCCYQKQLIKQYDEMAEEYDFITIDATRSEIEVFEDIKEKISSLTDES